MRRMRSACARRAPRWPSAAPAASTPPPARSRRSCAGACAALEPSLRPVLNATGVVLHTNLGRAPLAEAALARVQAVAAGYSNLELDLATGSRGSRQDHVAALICELTGAEAAICVNNGAAALVLALAALGGGRDVIVSRGQLVEIGDGFRIPEIVQSAGARLREVGTTNRTTAADYTRARRRDRRAALRAPLELPRGRLHRRVEVRELARDRARRDAPARLRRRLGRPARDRRAGRRAARARRPARRLRSRLLLGRQAARRPAGRDPRRDGGCDRRTAAATRWRARCGSTSCRWPRSRPPCASIATAAERGRNCPCAARRARARRARACTSRADTRCAHRRKLVIATLATRGRRRTAAGRGLQSFEVAPRRRCRSARHAPPPAASRRACSLARVRWGVSCSTAARSATPTRHASARRG